MIAKLKGLVDSILETSVILDVNGVCYQAQCSRATLSSLTQGEAATLCIETVLRQDSLQLFGFGSKQEQEMFRLLTTVQGVGMRMGLAILSTLSIDDVVRAIATQDKATLTRADGVGPKLAARLLNELKDKMPAMESPASASVMKMEAPHEDAISALINLGYRRIDATQAVSKVSENAANMNDILREALSALSRA